MRCSTIDGIADAHCTAAIEIGRSRSPNAKLGDSPRVILYTREERTDGRSTFPPPLKDYENLARRSREWSEGTEKFPQVEARSRSSDWIACSASVNAAMLLLLSKATRAPTATDFFLFPFFRCSLFLQQMF